MCAEGDGAGRERRLVDGDGGEQGKRKGKENPRTEEASVRGQWTWCDEIKWMRLMVSLSEKKEIVIADVPLKSHESLLLFRSHDRFQMVHFR